MTFDAEKNPVKIKSFLFGYWIWQGALLYI